MIEDKEYVADSEDLCIIPKNTRFAYINKSDETTEVVLVHSPRINIENEVFEGDYF